MSYLVRGKSEASKKCTTAYLRAPGGNLGATVKEAHVFASVEEARAEVAKNPEWREVVKVTYAVKRGDECIFAPSESRELAWIGCWRHRLEMGPFFKVVRFLRRVA